MKLQLLAASLAAVALSAAAQQTPRVDQRQSNQEARIQEGKASGALTTREAARLEAGQGHVQKVEDKAKADGKVTKKEKARLHHAQEKQSRKIAKQKHDAQKAPPSGADAKAATTPIK